MSSTVEPLNKTILSFQTSGVVMFMRLLLFAAFVIASPEFTSAQDVFWSFSESELITELTVDAGIGPSSSSVYIFTDGDFGFDAMDLDFAVSDTRLINITGGEAFNPTFDTIDVTAFDFSEVSIDADGSGGNLFSVSITQIGINPSVSALFNPSFRSGVGPGGAVLLARVDFDLLGDGNSELDLF